MLRRIKEKHLQAWIGGYLRHIASQLVRPRAVGPKHLLFAICDHFEPLRDGVSNERGEEIVASWERGYPQMAEGFCDASGNPPKHTFFYPGEEYEARILERLVPLAKAGFGEVELHLHHDGDDRESLEALIRASITHFDNHGHLGRDSDGNIRYGFIHGNWALANSRDDHRWCGVDDEFEVLFQTGCYGDFTFPAPNECQPNIVNQIYWPTGDLRRRRAFDTGERARVGRRYDDRVLIMMGPSALAPRRNRIPLRIEMGNLDSGDPPTGSRLRTWMRQRIHVAGRPDWVFVKVHTHGAVPATTSALLGEPGRDFHTALARACDPMGPWRLHYVTAREMFNIALAAVDGMEGDPAEFRDYVIKPPPAVCR